MGGEGACLEGLNTRVFDTNEKKNQLTKRSGQTRAVVLLRSKRVA